MPVLTFDSNVIMTIKNIKSKNTGSFDVGGAIKWLFPAETVDSHGEQIPYFMVKIST